jgi:hypothetical protein
MCDSRFAVTISPALAVLLANFLISETPLSWKYNRFESTVALSELKCVVVQSQDIPNRLDRLVHQLPSPLLEPDETSSFSVPMVGNGALILNAPDSDYADVMAPYCLAYKPNYPHTVQTWWI